MENTIKDMIKDVKTRLENLSFYVVKEIEIELSYNNINELNLELGKIAIQYNIAIQDISLYGNTAIVTHVTEMNAFEKLKHKEKRGERLAWYYIYNKLEKYRYSNFDPHKNFDTVYKMIIENEVGALEEYYEMFFRIEKNK